MKGISKGDIFLSLLISLSYFIFWSLAIFISGSGDLNFWVKAIAPYSWQILFVTLINLLLHIVAIPLVRTRKTKGDWPIIIILLLVLLTVGFKSWNRLGEYVSILPQTKNGALEMDAEVKNVLFQLFGLGYFASIKFYTDSYKLKIKNQQLTIEKQTSELNYLKSQTNPHFLFNTLNNIYTLSREKSDLAPESLLRLSGILRYMLYETQRNLVAIDQEIKIMVDYIELEKLRYDQSLKVHFSFNTDSSTLEVPPLLMIPLVENAFKHGVSETMNNPFINIQLTIEHNTLSFIVENSVNNNAPTVPVKESIGLCNLRRQLELLFNGHELKIENGVNSFFARMFINLRSYAKH